MSNRNFDASQIPKRVRDLNVAQQLYGAFINGKAPGNPQTASSQTSIITTEYYPGVQTTAEQSLQGTYSFNLGGIANYLTGPDSGPIVTVPGAPFINSITPGNGQAIVYFTAGSDGGSPIIGYEYALDSGSFNSATLITGNIVISGLVNDTTYQVKIRAVNAIGPGANSNTISVTPELIPPSGDIYTSPSNNQGVDIVPQSPFGGGGNSYDFGSGDYLSLVGDNSWAFGTDDFTIEWFQYQTDNSPFPRIFQIGVFPSISIGCSIEGGSFYAWFSGATFFGSVVPYKNQWVHFAIVRRSGNLYVYKNGEQLGLAIANTTNITNNSTTLYIGVENGGTTGTQFTGYLTNMRIVKGLAVYTGNFTVPTSSLTLVAGANPYGGSNTVAIPADFTKLLLVPASAPSAPTNLVGTSASGQVSIQFTDGSDGGSPITGYKYSVDNGEYQPVGLSKPIIITGLTNGTTYSFKIRAVNSLGDGAESSSILITPLPGSGLVLFFDAANYESGSIWPESSGKSKNATLFNSPIWSSSNGGRLEFNGSNQYASIPAETIDFSNGITILSLVNFGNPGSGQGWERILDFGNGSPSNNIILTRQSIGTNLIFEFYNGSTTIFSYSIVDGIENSAWGLYGGKANGTTYRVFTQDANNVGSDSSLPPSIQRNNNYIGRSNWAADNYFEGYMGVIAVFNTALSDEDITSFFDIFKSRYLPSPPTGLSATPGNGQATISFTPGSDNGSAITNYKYSTDGTSFNSLSPADATSPVTVTGLTNGTAYSISLKAVNNIGDSVASAPVSFTTPTVPLTTDITLIDPYISTVYISYYNYGDGGSPITGYQYTIDDGITWLPCIVEGPEMQTTGTLTNGVVYTIKIRAVNAIGDGVPSNGVTFTMSNVPEPPTNLSAIAGNSQATISFEPTPEIYGRLPITDYKYSVDGGAYMSIGIYTNPFTITGLNNGQSYSITMIATNAIGDSAASLPVSVTPFTVPEAPINLSATPDIGQATISFDQISNGGSAITNYKYSTDGINFTALSPADATSPITVIGLNNGESYTIYLKAVNAAGDSPASAPVSVTPDGVLTITEFTTVGSTTWTAPARTTSVEYLVVGGGGGSGGNSANLGSSGGGGGGMVKTGTLSVTPNTNYNIGVGDGGTGGNGGLGITSTKGNSGSNSSFNDIISLGGGGGDSVLQSVDGFGGNSANNVTNTASDGGEAGVEGGAGGGGGSTADGGIGLNIFLGGGGGKGGAGTTSSISGSSMNYGVGGQGADYPDYKPIAGANNTGNGASGRSSTMAPGAKGGSGIVILRYYV